MFDLLQKIKDGAVQLKEEEAIAINKNSVKSDVLAENQIQTLSHLIHSFRENVERRDNEDDHQLKPIEGRFWLDTHLDESADLSSLYEANTKRLYKMYCRHIFWGLIQ